LGCLFVLMGLYSCTVSEPADPTSNGTRYAPYQLGQYWEYSVRYLESGDTLQRLVRHEVIEAETAGLDSIFTLGVFEQVDQNWVQEGNLLVRKNDTQLLTTDDNTISLDLVFPVVEDKSWFRYPNADETLSEFPLEMIRVDEPLLDWNKTLTVESVSQLGIQLQKVYAEDIGLVFVLIEPEFEEWTLISYGVE